MKNFPRWYMEIDCYLKNYNGTRTFEFDFPVQDTTATYYDGLKGTFSYYG